MAYLVTINRTTQQDVVDSDTPQMWVLRDVIGLTDTKYGCGIAACGACTVHINGQARRSCITPISAIGSAEVRTVESLGKTEIGQALQSAWQEIDVVQCGYCQSGQLMSAAALLASVPSPSDDAIDASMAGNICRCGTYGRIRE